MANITKKFKGKTIKVRTYEYVQFNGKMKFIVIAETTGPFRSQKQADEYAKSLAAVIKGGKK